MAILCSLLAVSSVYAQDDRHEVVVRNPKIYRLPLFERTLLLNARERALFGSDIGKFHTQVSLGLIFIIN